MSGLFDRAKKLSGKAKKAVGGHKDQAKDTVDKAADIAQSKTGHKYDDKIETGADKAKDLIDKLPD
jgi:hypothetical protein